jgi:LuxR family maltose regulon positive regulatory protein
VFELKAEVSPNLLVTKLYIPLTHKNLVPRPRLVRILDESWQQDRKLILVSASAGYGKTTLVTEWLRGLQIRSAWLSLDEADNDPARFLAYLIAALQQIDRRIGENTRAMLQSPQPLPPEVVLTALINEIANAPTLFILVLDDYHVIEALPIHQQFDFLVEHQPPQMHLVIVTREDPPLPLARLRARGQMVEIRQADLRFLPEECADFLQRVMGLNLSLDDIAALERRTEGWIAGLQLAALSMQGYDDLPGFIEAFTGSSHFVLDYLIEEVFERQSAEVQDFLLKTSILDRLTGPLCDAVAGRAGSRFLLDRLEHANLFIFPLDQSHTWYRYHRLFAELLHQRLRSNETISEDELHRLACQWFAAEGFLPEAIEHALAASDWERAAELISQNTVMMLRSGELITLLGWCKSLPDEVIYRCPQLSRDYGWALTLTGQLGAADAYLRRAAAAMRGDNALLGTILVAQAYNLRIRGNHLQAIDRAQRAQALLPQEDHLSRGLVALTLGFAFWNSARLGEAEQAFLEVDRAAQLSSNHYARVTALTYIGLSGQYTASFIGQPSYAGR